MVEVCLGLVCISCATGVYHAQLEFAPSQARCCAGSRTEAEDGRLDRIFRARINPPQVHTIHTLGPGAGRWLPLGPSASLEPWSLTANANWYSTLRDCILQTAVRVTLYLNLTRQQDSNISNF